MLKNSSKILFLLVLILGTMVTSSSNSWLGAWMGLEINLLAFIPLISTQNNMLTSETMIKYFITQALASSVLLFAIIAMSLKFSFIQYPIQTTETTSMMILSSLLLKLGAAPFHFWFPKIMEGLSWTNALILLTWQKIAPITLISMMINQSMIYWIIIMSAIIGSLGGLNQTSLRKIMAFSSINHIAWMLAALMYSENMLTLYFSIYSFLNMTLIVFFNCLKISHINQVFSIVTESNIMKFIVLMNLLSLGGLPPFLGFLPKWMVIEFLTMNGQMMLMILLTTTALITLYFYLRIAYAGLMINSYSKNWSQTTTYQNSPNIIMSMMTFISLFSLVASSLIYNMA